MTQSDAERMRDAAAKVAKDHRDDAIRSRQRPGRARSMKFASDEARAEIWAEERGEKIASEMIEKAILALPLPAPAPDPRAATVCGACGEPWTGEKCGQQHNAHPFPVCYPIQTEDGPAPDPRDEALRIARETLIEARSFIEERPIGLWRHNLLAQIDEALAALNAIKGG